MIYVKSERAGLRVLDSVRRFVGKRLKLTVSEEKSAVAKVSTRSFLGYNISAHGQLRIAMTSRVRLIQRLRQLLRKARGRSLRHTIDQLNPVLRGWAAYFKLATRLSARWRRSMVGFAGSSGASCGDSGSATEPVPVTWCGWG